jgi:hypothetical protein
MNSNPPNPPITPLTGTHLRTYNTIFQHPMSHNLEWRAVRSLLAHLCTAVEEPNGNLRVTRNGQVLVLHPSRSKDVSEADEVMGLRRFLEKSESAPAVESKIDSHWLLVIDHHEARIYRSEMDGTVPQRILPHEPSEFFRHAHNSKDFARGRERPDPNSFFEPVAKELQAAGQLLIFGSGKGTSSEMEQFVGWLKVHHQELARRVIGSETIDEHHLSERQLLAKAREFYAGALKA